MTSRERAAFAQAARWLRDEIGHRHTDAIDWSVHCTYANWIVGEGMGPWQTDVAEIAESLSLDGVAVYENAEAAALLDADDRAMDFT